MFPVLFTIGNFNVYAFGFFLALSFLLSTFFIWKFAREELKEEEYLDAFLYTSLFSLLSARIVYIIFHFDEFGVNILRFIVVRETPGLSLLGGFLGGFVFLFWYSRGKKYDFNHLLDLFSLVSCIALVLSKIGEQLGGAGFGKVTSLAFAVRIVGLTGLRHPVEVYEATVFLTLAILLYMVYKRTLREKWPSGFVFCLFTLGLSLTIFLLEFLKEYRIYLYGLSSRQAVALIIILIISLPTIRKLKVIREIARQRKI